MLLTFWRLSINKRAHQKHLQKNKQLAEVMRKAARKGHVQIVVTSHSSEFISALKLNEVFHVSVVEGKTAITALGGNKQLKANLKDISLGELYTTGFIDAVS